jgi:DNA-directed RNA polymerase I subunit RPA43
MSKRGPTAYFLFADDVRANITADIRERDGKVNVAAIGKAIGVLWKELTEEQRQKYKDIAAKKSKEIKERLAVEQAEGGDTQEDDQHDGAAPSTSAPTGPPFGFPTSLVKRIMCIDPDVNRVSAEAIRATSKATELFLQLLATKCGKVAASQKRRTLRFNDVEAASKKDRRLIDMGLNDLLVNDNIFDEVRARIEEENQHRLANTYIKKKGQVDDQNNKGMKSLTSFFPTAQKDELIADKADEDSDNDDED